MTQTNKRSLCDLAALLEPGLFRALCDPTRIAILSWIARQSGPKTVGEVATSGCCDVDVSVVSRHLASLEKAGILERARRGKEVHYTLRAAPIASALRAIADALEASKPRKKRSDP
jgi:ArsR family transcriptional regulator